MKYFTLAMVLILGFTSAKCQRGDEKSGFPLAYSQDFENHSSIDGFEFSDHESWFLTSGKDGGRALELAGRGDYEAKVRSPFSIGLISGMMFGDFVLEADLLQTGKEYGHRDMCLFFNFQDSTRFYYVHMASKADQNAQNVFIVNDSPRTNFADEITDGVQWIDDHWHHIRLERYTNEGSIKVYFDDMETPIMLANDKTFTEGLIGFGSFDDSGKIDNIRIWSPDAEKTESSIFSKKE